MKQYDSKVCKQEEKGELEEFLQEPATNQVGVNGGCQEVLIRAFEGEPDSNKLLGNLDELEFVPRQYSFKLPYGPIQLSQGPPPYQATWNSVLLFFNLADNVAHPSDYQVTSIQDALEFLDQGSQPATITISEFMLNYWGTLSNGKLAFGIDTPRDESNQPLIPTLSPTGGASAWGELIKLCVEANPQQIWEASGSLMLDAKRWIPSVVLIQRYHDGLAADFGAHTLTINGTEYVIGDQHHMHYNLVWSNPVGTGGTPADGRMIWGRMCHEYAHNFLEFGDLYQGSGCTGYWDLFGDNSQSKRMSEVCSHIKERAGWLEYKQVIEGPTVVNTSMTLKPFTTTGEAIKVVPAPEKNPHEFFLLEFRKSTGNEIWRPDGGLSEEGLLITHINKRMLVNGQRQPPSPFLRDAPFYDPEFADFSDNGGTLWTGMNRLNGILFPQPENNRFTPNSSPNSNFYGQIPSGLQITNIQVEGDEVTFDLTIDCNVRVGWTVTGVERGLAGHFFDDPTGGTEQIFFRDAERVGVLVHRQAQWLVHRRQDDWIGEWNLGPDNYEVIGDLDGDGFDEVYLRSHNWAGVLKWRNGRFQTITVQFDWIMQWNLGPDNQEIAADVDGDSADEIFIRSPNWAGILKLVEGDLQLQSIQEDWIDQWNLGPEDKQWSGRFTQNDKDEILIRSAEWLGLLEWDAVHQRLRLKSIQHDWIDQWNLGPDDRQYIGDFDGDGLDEIYIRSPTWAGVFKWAGNRFQLLWIGHLVLNPWDGMPKNSIDLLASDESFVGRFLDNRDGILHRFTGGIAILHWRNSEMQVRHKFQSPFGGKWHLGANDNLILGQFIRGGPDVGNPANIFVQPDLSGIFIHNSWGTGSVGVNYLRQNTNDIKEVIGLDWIQRSKLLFAT